ncbi:MAG: UDP-N-acetylmuramate--L-alanine ligase [Bacteroidales bacterium]|nr:UDP-N-acetylmuramate--L-alanine ligase [Bacteroidales bacterium]
MYNNYYFLGIGGIGMSAIARYFKHIGKNVSGYDKTPSPLTRELESEGIEIHYEDRPDLIPFNVEKTFIVYTPAIPETLGEFQFVKENGYSMCKRSRMLGEIARAKKCLAVAGTHGKTTTSGLLAHIFQDSKVGCSAFLGGIAKNYDTNLLVSTNTTIVVEADEFDRSFLQLYPNIAIITSADADHLDIYGTAEEMRSAFEAFASQVKADGTIIVKQGVNLDLSKVKAKVLHYSYDNPSDFYASDIIAEDGGYFNFTLNYPGGSLTDCRVGIPGWVNVENAIAAAAAALLYGIAPGAVRCALANYKGIKRRFDIHINRPDTAYIDDYAHHPKEIEAAISSIRDIFKGRKICGIFQPHLYTRTRDFATEFANALSKLDEVILLPIYPARELPIAGVDSKMIFDMITIPDKVMVEKENLMETLAERKIDCLVTFGAGDIDRFVEKIEAYLNHDI